MPQISRIKKRHEKYKYKVKTNKWTNRKMRKSGLETAGGLPIFWQIPTRDLWGGLICCRVKKLILSNIKILNGGNK